MTEEDRKEGRKEDRIEDGVGILYGACSIKLYTIKLKSLVEVPELAGVPYRQIQHRVLATEFQDDKVNGTGLYFCSDGKSTQNGDVDSDGKKTGGNSKIYKPIEKKQWVVTDVLFTGIAAEKTLYLYTNRGY